VLEPSPLRRNLILRFMNEGWGGGGGVEEMMKDALSVSQEGYRDSCKEENVSVVYVNFPSVHG
jgi:hypothetical protein